MDALIRLDDVTKRYGGAGRAALDGIGLQVAIGEAVAIMGPSGSGKSTLLNLVAGLDRPTRGAVTVAGQRIDGLTETAVARFRRQQVGMIFQFFNLLDDLTVLDNVLLPAQLAGVRRGDARARADELLTALRISAHAHAYPARLSGGERQRVAIARALVNRPALLLADEPTGELDDASAGAIRALIVELARTNGTSVILVTHDPGTAGVADRTLMIRDGRIVSDRRAGEGQGQEALVIDSGWLRLPPDLLTQAGIGRRALARPAPEGVIVTRGTGDSGPTAPAAAHAPPQPPQRWVPARVELCSVARTYGNGLTRRQVLSGLTHEFAPGQLTVVTGRSGAGKTTLLKLMAGLDRPSSGQVVLDGHSLGDDTGEQLASLRRQRIGYLSQEPAPIGFLSAEENTVLILRIRGWDADAAAERAVTVLTRAGLADRARQRVHRLSAGEAQRLALARALAGARGLLIADEPTSRQDEASARAVAALLAAAAHQEGQTVICATHDPTVISHADHVMALEE